MEALSLLILFIAAMFTVWIPASIVGDIFIAVRKEFIWMWMFIFYVVLFTVVASVDWLIIYSIYLLTR